MLGVFYVVIPYFFFEKSERVNRIKKEVLNAKHNAFVKKMKKDLNDEEVQYILEEKTEKPQTAARICSFILAYMCIGWVILFVYSFFHLDDPKIWILLIFFGAIIVHGTTIYQNKAKDKEVNDLKTVTLAIYYKLQKIQEAIEPGEHERSNAEKKGDIEYDPLIYPISLWAIYKKGIKTETASKYFKISLNRTEKIIDQMEKLRICGPNKDSIKPRDILVSESHLDWLKSNVLNND